jgi:dynein heavy chain, axonemal
MCVLLFSVKRLANPPFLIMLIMDCVQLLFQRRLDPVSVDANRPCVKPSWSEALKTMAAANFLPGLLSFPKVTIFNSPQIEQPEN